ncbi:MAG: NAD(P)/FAD-dependent oxidoreductase [Candidatus Moranbacteria bacterium]|nr:NAD(P)/FAD-dependent oxidoreductase [Candidatus Moranbacteria bacterium]MBP6034144.1 NAD(P)/FAD-dependent oxidoreductase [Candidatus Moranbacteria bacterium]MBP7695755.1 NAD(P)/FAD-dependent oxidoreductase [Candidatus Moranbacteria bacterium]
MKRIVILGGGTGGTMIAHRLAHARRDDWDITLIEKEHEHIYQPGLLFVPFGLVSLERLRRPSASLLPPSVIRIALAIDRIDPVARRVTLSDGTAVPYDVLIVATGVRLAPEEIPGMQGALWHQDIFDFYTGEGAQTLKQKLSNFTGGSIVVHITEMPIKCPVAPLEFACLAHDFFVRRGMRDRVSITYVTPLSEVFTRPVAAQQFSHFLEERQIGSVTDFAIERIDEAAKKMVAYDGREVPFDLLVTVPTNRGAECVGRSGLGDELDLVPTDPHTLQSKSHPDIFVLGDASDIPASKAGSSAHFQTGVVAQNVRCFLEGIPLTARYDGHANCFVELGAGEAAMIDFSYEMEPLPGVFPVPIIGPFRLLEGSRINHWGKKFFSFIYWNFLLKDRPLPFFSDTFSLAGKRLKQK